MGLRKLGLNAVIDTPCDNLPLYQLADFMLFDYGGPPFGGIYTGKRFVLLNVPGAESDPLTGGGSPDLLLRNDFASVESGSGGIEILLNDEHHWKAHQAMSDKWRTRHFAPYFGTSSQIAAEKILNRAWLKHGRE